MNKEKRRESLELKFKRHIYEKEFKEGSTNMTFEMWLIAKEVTKTVAKYETP